MDALSPPTDPPAGPDSGPGPLRVPDFAGPAPSPLPDIDDDGRVGMPALAVLRGLFPFARQHGRPFALGAAAALLVVAARLSLPWPLRAVADRASGAPGSEWLLALVPAGVDPILAMGVVFLVLVSLLGFSDYLGRLSFARFAGATVADLRASALAGAVGMRRGHTGGNTGALVNRFVADAPSIRSGIQRFLVHVATSGVLIAGMTAVLFGMDRQLGLVFLGAGILTVAVTAWTAARIFRHTLRQRQRLGELANRLHAAFETGEGTGCIPLGRLGEARQTHLQGIATWTAHAIFGAAILAALTIASSAVSAGTMSAGDLVVFLMYALMLHSPIVRLARQGSKTGKIFGAAHRLLRFVPPSPREKSETP